jgi:hypothetical protein
MGVLSSTSWFIINLFTYFFCGHKVRPVVVLDYSAALDIGGKWLFPIPLLTSLRKQIEIKLRTYIFIFMYSSCPIMKQEFHGYTPKAEGEKKDELRLWSVI